MSSNEISILGAGMHPWGKWGRSFVDYGVIAARAALQSVGTRMSSAYQYQARSPARSGS